MSMRYSICLSLSLALSSLVVACGGDDDANGGEEPGPGNGEALVGCLVDEEYPITAADQAPDGFALTPAEALERAIGTWAGTLTLAEGGEVPLELHIELVGALAVHERSWQSPAGSGGREIAMSAPVDCEHAYALPVQVRVQALPDLDVERSLTLHVTASGLAGFGIRVAHSDHAGDAEPPEAAMENPEEITAVDLNLSAALQSAGGWSGEVSFGIERQHGTGPDGSVSYGNVPYGTWSVSAGEESGDEPQR